MVKKLITSLLLGAVVLLVAACGGDPFTVKSLTFTPEGIDGVTGGVAITVSDKAGDLVLSSAAFNDADLATELKDATNYTVANDDTEDDAAKLKVKEVTDVKTTPAAGDKITVVVQESEKDDSTVEIEVTLKDSATANVAGNAPGDENPAVVNNPGRLTTGQLTGQFTISTAAITFTEDIDLSRANATATAQYDDTATGAGDLTIAGPNGNTIQGLNVANIAITGPEQLPDGSADNNDTVITFTVDIGLTTVTVTLTGNA